MDTYGIIWVIHDHNVLPCGPKDTMLQYLAQCYTDIFPEFRRHPPNHSEGLQFSKLQRELVSNVFRQIVIF